MLPNCSEFQSQNVQTYGYEFHYRNGQHHGQTSKTQWFFLNEICTDTRLRTSCGKDNLVKFYWDLDGKKLRIVNVCSLIENKDYSYRYTWMTSKWLERSRICHPSGRILWRWNANQMKATLNSTQRCLNHVLLLEQLKITRAGKSVYFAKTVAWSYDMEGHASKMRWPILWRGRKESGAAIQSLKSLLGWSPIQERRASTCRRLIRSMLTNCTEMIVPGTHRSTRHSVVGPQTCSCSHTMESGMMQTFGKIDFVYPSHKWLPTPLSRVQHSTARSIVFFFPRLRLCWRPWGLKINLGDREFMYIWKSNTCPRQLDVQEANVSIPQLVLQNLKLSRLMLDYESTVSLPWTSAMWSVKCCGQPTLQETNRTRVRREAANRNPCKQ